MKIGITVYVHGEFIDNIVAPVKAINSNEIKGADYARWE